MKFNYLNGKVGQLEGTFEPNVEIIDLIGQKEKLQDFKGLMMENGACYINTVGNIKKDKNRLSGKIVVYEMPEYTAVEIDEPDDFLLIEKLMEKHKND